MPKAYPPEMREQAIEHAQREGVTAAAKALGIDKGTISRWCVAAGVATVATARTQKATEAARLRWEERRADLVHDLGDLAADSLEAIKANLVVKPRTAADLSVVLERAIRNAQLLSGSATSRSDLGVTRGEVLADARDRGLRLVG